MRTIAMQTPRKISLAEMLTELTRSLAFQVDMIMWEDRKSEEAQSQSVPTKIGKNK